MAAAKQLLTDAGYPNGFEVEMDCPNDRYVNDEAICQAVAQMQARVGIKVKLNAMPKSMYFEKAGPSQKYNFILQPAGLDSGLVRQLERDRQHHRLPRRRREGRSL